jgi:HK97 family phage prohead protease
MNQRKVQPEIERRAVGELVEVRATDTGGKKLRGYALKWNTRYNMGWFTEEIDRDALNESDLTDVRALLNHDANIVLGRTTSGTLRLLSDDTGLMYEVDLPDTQAARDLAVSIERGDISQSSWGFMLRVDQNDNGDEWRRENGKDHRVIKRVGRVFDVSAVTFPANPDTSVAKRSIDAIHEDTYNELLNRRAAQIRAILAQYPNK